MFRCVSNGLCIPTCQLCDGYSQCGDYSDEANCAQNNSTFLHDMNRHEIFIVPSKTDTKVSLIYYPETETKQKNKKIKNKLTSIFQMETVLST